MKKLFGILFLLVVSLPALAQWQQWRLSSQDQGRFDSYYSRWQEYRQKNDRDQILSMEKRMLDVYAHYNIPAETPFWRVASNAREDRDQWRGRLSVKDQGRFDSYFSRWQEYRRRNDRGQIASMEKRMQDVYAHYNIPSGIPYSAVASSAREEDRNEVRNNDRDEDQDYGEHDHWRGRLSREDQGRFDSYYQRWLEYRRDGNRSDMANMERRMYDVMERYEIPQQLPFERIASRE